MKRSIIIFVFAFIFSFVSEEVFSQRSKLSEPAWVYVGKAKRFIAEGDNDNALNILNTLIFAYPENADAYFLLAQVYEKEAKDPTTPGGLSAYTIAITQYKKAISLSKNLTIPSQELDSYFRLLNIYEYLMDMTNYAATEESINILIDKTPSDEDKGRIYFRLAQYYGERNRDLSSIDFYRKSYEMGYRKKLSLFRISLVYRKMRDYSKEKENLMLANKYDFEYLEPSNFEVEKAITMRLKELVNVKLPLKFY